MTDTLIIASLRILPEAVLALFVAAVFVWRQVAIHEWRLQRHDEDISKLTSVLDEIRADVKDLLRRNGG